MNDAAAQRLRELLWRPRLTEAEAAELQKLLAAHPEARTDGDVERELTQVLERLPEAPPVATNFTALVMQEIEREASARNRADKRRSWRLWLPRLAFTCLLAGVGIAGWHQHQVNARRAAMARDVAQLGALIVSAPELSQNLNTIRRLDNSAPKPDTELLADLTQ